jgi:hypothetical protein
LRAFCQAFTTVRLQAFALKISRLGIFSAVAPIARRVIRAPNWAHLIA